MLTSCITVGVAALLSGTALAGPLRRDVPSSTGASVLPIATGINAPSNDNLTVNLGQLLLLPAVHWEHDSNDLNNLKPNQSHSIYFTPDGGNADPSKKHAFIQANITMQKPTVILDHCGSIKTVKCGNDGVSVTFENKDAFDTAKSYWSNNVTLGTNSDDCGQLTHQSSFWDIKSLNFDESGLSVLATVDQEIDIGNHTEECEATWGRWIPTEAEATPVSSQAALITPAPSLAERGFLDDIGLGGVTSKIGGVISNVVSDAKSVGNVVKSDVKSVANVVTSVLDIDKTITGNIPLNAKPTKYDAAAPWPSAFHVADHDGFKAYCVDCYTSGNIHFAGEVKWNVLKMDISKAQGDMSGNLEAQLVMGVDADGAINLPTVSVTIFNPNVEEWVASSLLTIGPYLTVKAELDTQIQMKGQAKVGAKMKIPDMKIHLDLKDGSQSSQSGFTPTFDTIAEANATIGLTASVGLPIEIGIGLIVPAIKLDKKVSLTEAPKVIGHIEGNIGTNAQDQSCDGLPWDISFNNDLYFTAWNTKKDLFNKTWDLKKGCISLPGRKSSSAASSVHSSTVSNAKSSTVSDAKSSTVSHAESSTITSARGSVTNSASASASAAAGTGLKNPLHLPPFSALESILHQSHASSSVASQSVSVSRSASIITPTPDVSSQSSLKSTASVQSAEKSSASAAQSKSADGVSSAQSTSTAAPAPYSAKSSAQSAPAAYSSASSAQSASTTAPAGYSSASAKAQSSSTTAPAGYSSASAKAQSSSSTSCTEEEVATSSKATQTTATTLSSKVKSVEASSTSSKASSSSVKSAAQYTPEIIEPTPAVY